MNIGRFVAKSLVHSIIDWSGEPSRQRERLRGKLIILTYHSFCSKWPRGLFNSLPVDRFEKQICFLRNNFKLVSLQQGLDNLQQGLVDDLPWLAITIDDGFRDNYTHAWPVFKRYSVPATIFLATDFIDTGRPPWPTQLVEILERTKVRFMEAPFRADLKSISECTTVVQRLMKYWSPLTPEQRFHEIDVLRRHLQVDEQTRYPPLTWDQIREMRSTGIFFGSHTVYHSILPALNESVVRMEITESKKRIEDELQEPCIDFAFPNGNYSMREKVLLESEGFRLGLTQKLGVNDSTSDTFSFFRIEIPYHDPLSTFRARVSCCLS